MSGSGMQLGIEWSDGNEHLDNSDRGLQKRLRSVSEMYPMDIAAYSVTSPFASNSGDPLSSSRHLTPTLASMEEVEEKTKENLIKSGSIEARLPDVVVANQQGRGRLFSELSISEMPGEINDDNVSLNIAFPCSYEENMEKRGASMGCLRQAAIKRVVIRTGTKLGRFNIVCSTEKFYWPQETIRHCRTGRIKRGTVLKRQFGVYSPDKSKDMIALKVMEKNAISESFQWDEEDVQLELSVMQELSKDGGHENILYLCDSLETKEYLIAVMELVDGDLHDMLASIQGKDSVRDVFKQILLGYQYLVQHGYYHCDLSLENINLKFIPNYKGLGKTKTVAKLSDFGRVHRMDPDGHSIIDGDEVSGKPYYLAPEAYVGSYEAGPADMWSLGIILFILISGHPPFGIANDSDEMFEPFSESGFSYLLPLLENCVVTPEQLNLLKTLLSINPAKRPTVSEVLQMDWLQ